MGRAADTLIGSVIAGRFEVIRVIGKGGMGTIYEVRNTRLGRSFALKTLGESADAETLARFRREAEIVAKLTHPNILDVVDWDILEDGAPCMIMEYLRGEDLASRLKENGPLSWPDFARIADQVLSALSVAHRAGVIHRDLKPQNIFLAADDAGDERVKLLDFGISKLRDARSFTTTDQKVMGTPAYMPPEQAEGKQEEVGPASDVWSMATIFYEMATAKVAFEGPSIPAILYRVCHGRPEPLRSLRPDTPDALVALIERALVVPIAERLASVDQMRVELRLALSSIEGVSWPEPLRARNSGPSIMRGAAMTPPGGVQRVPRPQTGPDAMAATIAGGAATIAASGTASSPSAPVPVVAASSTVQPVSTPAAVRRSSRTPLAIAAVAGVLVLVVMVVAATRSRHPKPLPAVPSPPVAHVETPPTPAAAQTPPTIVIAQPPATPAKVTWALESSPAGADVYRMPSEVKVGTTPWHGELERMDGVAVFVLKKAGYVDKRVELDLHAGGTQRIELVKIAATSRPTRPAGTGSATTPPLPPPDTTGRKKGDPVDPFSTRKKGEPVDPFGNHH